jgi:hypothetical protein
MAYNASRGVKKMARASVPFSGDLFSPGAAKPWARTIPEPRELLLTTVSTFFFALFSYSYLQRRCQPQKSFIKL